MARQDLRCRCTIKRMNIDEIRKLTDIYGHLSKRVYVCQHSEGCKSRESHRDEKGNTNVLLDCQYIVREDGKVILPYMLGR